MSTTHKQEVSRVIRASVIGATIEWYDFFLYGVIAGLVFNKLYFPSDDAFIGTMLAYTTFAIGFVARPLGGVIFGHIGDRVSRKGALIATLVLMGASTVAIGLIPSYDSIGVWAPILLLLCRILQGIGLGGEWGGAVLMAYEYAPKEKRGLYASWPQVGLALGLCLASGVVAILTAVLTPEDFYTWGWRVAFLLSALLVFLGLYIRVAIKESPEFEKLKASNAENKQPFVSMIKQYPGNIIRGMGARYIDGVLFNIFGVFSISYLSNDLNMDRTTALTGVLIASFIMCFSIPFFGALSDKVGRTKTYFWGSIITGFSAVPALYFMTAHSDNTLVVWLSIIIPFGILYASVYGPEAALFCELFDTDVRYTGISFVYQFSGIFASGITPMIATALLHANDGQPWYVAGYVVFAGLVSAYSAWSIKKSKQQKESVPTPVLRSRYS
ncbi:MFS transporter [Alcaligenaceae bacterium 429]|uniref:MFS transporter n=1 Tax=Paenalcaligenes sp. Me52 TaxID=3392038 RepID=UPI001091EC97|nr:MFS transporter [Alcaligenaceae bacterium 429]